MPDAPACAWCPGELHFPTRRPKSPSPFARSRLWRLAGLLALGTRFALAAGPPVSGQASPPAAETEAVARLYYGDRARLAEVVSRYDVFEFADHAQGYVLARLAPAEWAELEAAGFRLEFATDWTTALRRSPRPAAPQISGIPNYPCYRTVEETDAALDRLAQAYPHLATVLAIGPSWEKTVPGEAPGYDLRVLVLTRRELPGPKPRFFLLAAHHARELTTAETALRFAEELVAGYDRDPEATWLLDFHELHILPMANPDGRKLAEQGLWWRKNTCRTNGCTSYPRYGTDLNRNAGFLWGGVGASDEPCSEVFRGPHPFSEPESQALRDYLRELFPPQRPPDARTPAPDTASGLVISLHSFSELVLHPWGWTTNPAPNAAALATLGAKFGFFNRYRVQPSIELYPTTGSLDDWAYGELGVATYTFELGTNFFEDCSSFETVVWPANRPALWYAAKACREPYRAPAGPDVLEAQVLPARAVQGAPVLLRARADTTRSFGLKTLPPPRRVAAARACLNRPSWLNETPPQPLAAEDGDFDAPQETLVATLDTSDLAPGRHTVFFEAQNEDGIWGVPSARFLWIEPLSLSAEPTPEGLRLRWPSLPGRTFTVRAADSLAGGFRDWLTGLPDTAPENTRLIPWSTAGPRFFQIRVER